jgi:hypothetical protein
MRKLGLGTRRHIQFILEQTLCLYKSLCSPDKLKCYGQRIGDISPLTCLTTLKSQADAK